MLRRFSHLSAVFIFLFTWIFEYGYSIDFPTYKPSEQYKCGAFLRGRVDDRALSLYYGGIRQFVDWLSLPFPHRELLSNDALRGDLNEWRDSLENRTLQWVSWQQWWLSVAVGVLILSILFPICYILYRCCVCCCDDGGKKTSTDTEYDGCKRNFLNIVIAVLVVINVFAAASLLVTSQYAEYGLEELPNRLNQCVDDLNLYKRETDLKVRKLLIDDFNLASESLMQQISHAGHSVIDRVKKVTGAHAIDIFLNITQGANDVRHVLLEVAQQARELNEAAGQFAVEFGRLRKTAENEIAQCTHTEPDSLKTMCLQAQRLLDNISSIKFEISEQFLMGDNAKALTRIAEASVSSLLVQSNQQFIVLENELQRDINQRSYAAQNMLKTIGDDLFQTAESVSTYIRQLNFDPLYQAIAVYNGDKYFPVKDYIHYSWYISLAVTGLVCLASLSFLFGLFFGICGRRPTYYNDDCCVRSTGASFYSCGIWMLLCLFTVLSVLTVVLMLIFANVTHMVCNPLDDPLARPDVMSFVERYIEMAKHQDNWNQSELGQILDSRSPVELIRACQRNETFYQMFDLDKKYHLADLNKFDQDAIKQLDDYLEKILGELPIEKPLGAFVSEKELEELHSLSDINITQLSADGLAKIKRTIDSLDLMSKVNEFTTEADSIGGGKPQAVSSIIEQIQEIDVRIAQPLRSRLEILYKNLTVLDTRLHELQVPVSSLIGKLEHAQALLSQDVRSHVEQAAKDILRQLIGTFESYVGHAKFQIESDVSSCGPISDIARNSRTAVCGHTIDPINGAWMSLLISLLVSFPIVCMATALRRLYNKMHSFPKYVVHEPNSIDHQMSSFVTDIYDARIKPGYPNYSYMDDYHRTYR
ncbi:unnamed protein product, partial [Mesorhabditis belari]|uniref:Prominin-like protein n=1 Tax=Mesorhabditis belari TaxID=2138241 RepID=A0AAF3J360_9BILA